MDQMTVDESELIVSADIAPKVIAEIDNISRSAENVEKALKAAKKAKESADSASQKSAGWDFTGRKKKRRLNLCKNQGLSWREVFSR